MSDRKNPPDIARMRYWIKIQSRQTDGPSSDPASGAGDELIDWQYISKDSGGSGGGGSGGGGSSTRSPKAFNLGTDFLSGNAAAGIFANVFSTAGNWDHGPWDAEGWPVSKVSGVGPQFKLALGLNYRWPSGVYKIRARGIGKLYLPLGNAGTITFDGSYRQDLTFTLPAQYGGFGSVVLTEILESQAGNNLRDIELMLPGHEFGEYVNHAWIADKKEAGYTAVRFMDAFVINAKLLVTDNIFDWDDTKRLGHGFTWALRGRLPEEIAIEICNAGDFDLWFNSQHTNTENWYDGAFNLIQNGGSFNGSNTSKLKDGLIVYHETSNEWWGGFNQHAHQHAWYLGRDLAKITAFNAANPLTPMGDIEHQAQMKCYYSEYFKAKFSGTNRVVKTCLMSQQGNPAVGAKEVQFWKLANIFDGIKDRKPDVIGCGLYVSPYVPGSHFVGVNMANVWTVFQTDPVAALNTLFGGIDQFHADMGPLFDQYIMLAANNGAIFAVYEYGDEVNCFTNPERSAMVVAYHRDPRQQANYTKMMDRFPKNGGPYLIYMDQSSYGNLCWGVDEYLDQFPKSPKRLAMEAYDFGTPSVPVVITSDPAPTTQTPVLFPASIEALSGRELISAKQLKSTTSHKIRMRKAVPINSIDNRIVFDGAIYNIDSVVSDPEPNGYHNIYATRVYGESP
jgi:hypothetical protein